MEKRIVYMDIVFSQYDKYVINDLGVITPENGSRLPKPFVFNSSNGNTYVLLKNSYMTSKFYRLDKIMAITFMKKEVFDKSIYDIDHRPHFEVEHINGDKTDCSLKNIRVVFDTERWTDVIYPETIIRGKYEVSSWGYIRRKSDRKLIRSRITDDGYVCVSLACLSENGTEQYKPCRLHRIIALHHIPNPNPEIYDKVDHLDGDKRNYSIDNLHWVTQKGNIGLAMICGRGNVSSITTEEIDIIIDLLQELNGSIRDTYEMCRRYGMSSKITKAVINNIKHKDPAYIRPDSKYDLKNIVFSKRTRKANLTDEDIHLICKKLVECNGDIGTTLQKLHEDGLTHIARHDIRHIRDKSKRSDISDAYFMREDFSRPREPLAEDIFAKVCEALAKCNGDMNSALKLVHSWGFDIVTKYDIQDAKYKKKRRDISDLYFTYDNKEFKLI